MRRRDTATERCRSPATPTARRGRTTLGSSALARPSSGTPWSSASPLPRWEGSTIHDRRPSGPYGRSDRRAGPGRSGRRPGRRRRDRRRTASDEAQTPPWSPRRSRAGAWHEPSAGHRGCCGGREYRRVTERYGRRYSGDGWGGRARTGALGRGGRRDPSGRRRDPGDAGREATPTAARRPRPRQEEAGRAHGRGSGDRAGRRGAGVDGGRGRARRATPTPDSSPDAGNRERARAPRSRSFGTRIRARAALPPASSPSQACIRDSGGRDGRVRRFAKHRRGGAEAPGEGAGEEAGREAGPEIGKEGQAAGQEERRGGAGLDPPVTLASRPPAAAPA